MFLAAALAMLRALGNRHTGWIAWCLEEFAGVWRGRGQLKRAARLLGAAEALREATVSTIPPDEHAEYAEAAAALRSALGEEAFAAAWAEGRALSMESAIALALAER